MDIHPEYLKDREIVSDELDDVLFESEGPLIQSFPIMCGSSRGKAGLFKTQEKPAGARECAILKAIFIKQDMELGETTDILQRVENLQAKLKPAQVIVRVYILEGRNLQDENSDQPPDCFLKVKIGKDEQVTKEVITSADPAFYKRFEFTTTLPGSSNLEIAVWDKDKIGADDLVGVTHVDLERRFFSDAWKNYKNKPIEMRALTKPFEKGFFGRLVMWIDIVPVVEEKQNPSYAIAPQEKLDCELRVVIWQTQDVAFRDEVILNYLSIMLSEYVYL